MTSSRAYRSALSPEEAYRRIIEGSGTQFDPSMVEIFKKGISFVEKNGPPILFVKNTCLKSILISGMMNTKNEKNKFNRDKNLELDNE